jgi:hypothetical protein
VAKFQNKNRISATSHCTRLSQRVRRLHNSARPLYRSHRRDHRNSVVTNPTDNAEIAAAEPRRTAHIPAGIGGSRQIQTSFETGQETLTVNRQKNEKPVNPQRCVIGLADV